MSERGGQAQPKRCRSIAIACNNASLRKGGEAAVPLRFFLNFRKIGVQCRLLVHERVKKELNEILPADALSNVTFFRDHSVQKLLFALSKPFPSSVREVFFYPLIGLITESDQRSVIRRLVAQGDVDAVFLPTPISPKAISLMNNVGAPVFFGPLNGDMNYPAAFRHKSNGLAQWAIGAARQAAEILHYLLPAKRNAAAIFVSNRRTLEALPRATRKTHIRRSFDATIDASQWREVASRAQSEDKTFLCVGRLADWKAFEFAIAATHRLNGAAPLTIVGDGPERARLEALAADGPGDIKFKGFLSHEEIARLYPNVIALVLPSLREAGGNVCMEALAAGAPVIATRWGGACDVVNPGVDGFLVPVDNEESLVGGIADAMRRLTDEPQLSRRMGEAGRSRVLEAFNWERKSLDFHRVFEECMARPHERIEDAHPAHRVDGGGVNLSWRGEA